MEQIAKHPTRGTIYIKQNVKSVSKYTQTELNPDRNYKAKIALQEKQILKLTYIVDQLEDKVSKDERLLAANEKLSHEIEEMKKSEEQRLKDEVLLKNVKKLFSPNQLHFLGNPNMEQCHWKEEDIDEAMELHAGGPNAYRILKRKGFPLPSEATLKPKTKRMGSEDKDLEDTDKNKNSHNSSRSVDDISQIKHSQIASEHIKKEQDEEDIEVEVLLLDSSSHEIVKGEFFFRLVDDFSSTLYFAEEEPLIIEDYIFDDTSP